MTGPASSIVPKVDDGALERAFERLSVEENEALDLLADPARGAEEAAPLAELDADALGVRAVRALERMSAELRSARRDAGPVMGALPEHLALALGRALSARLAEGERAVLERALAADPILRAQAEELQALWPRVRAWLRAPYAGDADAAEDEGPPPPRWARWLPIAVFVAVGVFLLVRLQPLIALFEPRTRLGVVPVEGAEPLALDPEEDHATEVVARRFVVAVVCARDAHFVLAAFPVRGPAWRAFPDPRSASGGAAGSSLATGFHVLPRGEGTPAFELASGSGTTSIVAAYRDEPLTDTDLRDIDAHVTQGSEAPLREWLDQRGFRIEMLLVVEPDR